NQSLVSCGVIDNHCGYCEVLDLNNISNVRYREQIQKTKKTETYILTGSEQHKDKNSQCPYEEYAVKLHNTNNDQKGGIFSNRDETAGAAIKHEGVVEFVDGFQINLTAYLFSNLPSEDNRNKVRLIWLEGKINKINTVRSLRGATLIPDGGKDSRLLASSVVPGGPPVLWSGVFSVDGGQTNTVLLLFDISPDLTGEADQDPDFCFKCPVKKEPKTLKPQTVLFRQDYMSSVLAVRQKAWIVFFIGTADGQLIKLAVDKNFHTACPRVLYRANDDRQVFPKIHLDQVDHKHVYLPFRNQVERVPVSKCSTYTTVQDCWSAQDPYCVWCSSKKSCTFEDDCKDSDWVAIPDDSRQQKMISYKVVMDSPGQITLNIQTHVTAGQQALSNFACELSATSSKPCSRESPPQFPQCTCTLSDSRLSAEGLRVSLKMRLGATHLLEQLQIVNCSDIRGPPTSVLCQQCIKAGCGWSKNGCSWANSGVENVIMHVSIQHRLCQTSPATNKPEIFSITPSIVSFYGRNHAVLSGRNLRGVVRVRIQTDMDCTLLESAVWSNDGVSLMFHIPSIDSKDVVKVCVLLPDGHCHGNTTITYQSSPSCSDIVPSSTWIRLFFVVSMQDFPMILFGLITRYRPCLFWTILPRLCPVDNTHRRRSGIQARRQDETSDLRLKDTSPPCFDRARPHFSATEEATSNSHMREPEPMQIGRTRLSPEERACRHQGNLCLYCGQAGHFVSRCPANCYWPSPPALLMDIYWGRAPTRQSPFTCCYLSCYHAIQFHILHSPRLPLILGYPWLRRHNLHMDWLTGAILGWGSSCHQVCLHQAVVPQPSHCCSTPPNLTGVPTEYLDFSEVFNKAKATSLPPHRPYDCAINLQPGTTPPDEWKTAFNTSHQDTMSIWLCHSVLTNAPAVFQSLVNDVLRDMLNKFVFVYLDDILIFSKNKEEHVHHVQAVLQRLLENSLFVKAEKCEFHASSVSFLGFIVGPGSLQMDPAKVSAVASWPTPSSCKQLQRFLGFANFYRRYIWGYSTVVAPLTVLTSSKVTFQWSVAANEAFGALKTRFTSAAILIMPDPERQFVLEVDASDMGVGAVLSQRSSEDQKLHPCVFFSRRLSPAERNYDIGNRELLASCQAGVGGVAPLVGGVQAAFFWPGGHFNFTLSYLPGSRNVKPDALSRQFQRDEDVALCPDTIISSSHLIAPLTWEIEERVKAAQEGQPEAQRLSPESTLCSSVPAVLQWAHSSRLTCHPGTQRTIDLVRQRYWWATVNQDTRGFVKACPVCNRHKSTHHAPAGLLQPLPRLLLLSAAATEIATSVFCFCMLTSNSAKYMAYGKRTMTVRGTHLEFVEGIIHSNTLQEVELHRNIISQHLTYYTPAAGNAQSSFTSSVSLKVANETLPCPTITYYPDPEFTSFKTTWTGDGVLITIQKKADKLEMTPAELTVWGINDDKRYPCIMEEKTNNKFFICQIQSPPSATFEQLMDITGGQ
ncbi:hypothetical protein L3Q82_009548, partial [Scortum barcoo]